MSFLNKPALKKLKCLESYISKFNKAVIAYSGGVDSSLLLKLSCDVLGKQNVLAVTAFSETYPQKDKEQALSFIRKYSVNAITINTLELQNPEFNKNPKNRCYHCKHELFAKITAIAKKHNIPVIFDGSNYDDLSDFRPGRKAVKQFKVKSPLLENKITKQEVREISRHLRLPTWNKPQMACLASRIPYGTRITTNSLTKIDKAENYLRGLGFYNVRVRHYGEIARIEVSKEQINKLFHTNTSEKILRKFKTLGYKYITIDLEGYRTGSMNL
ncbi:MAG: TIGR00268 family protein [Elusimicrobia bacterium RIFOXYA2_FULL_39_19]|nr:MAG: TIGR00268 family protein [Elusimicrobia bacterium RIFOXYA2_FULL_39_19]